MAAVFPVVLSTAAAVASIPSVYFRVARDLGIQGPRLLSEVTLPAIAPQVITTLRVTAGLAWLVVVAAEMIAGRDGLGFAVWDARNGLRIDLLAAVMVVIGLHRRRHRSTARADDAHPERALGLRAMTAPTPVLHLDDVAHAFGDVQVLQSLDLAVAARRVRRHRRPVGLRQDDDPQPLLGLADALDAAPCGGPDDRARCSSTTGSSRGSPSARTSRSVCGTCRRGRARGAGSTHWLGLVDLPPFERHYPHQLSGGMRQRVELVRALAGETDLLLMDEPFSSLDYLTRLRLRGELARLLHEQPRTVVLVTHDIEEAAQLADRVLVLSERPARVCDEVRIDVPRPRDLDASGRRAAPCTAS